MMNTMQIYMQCVIKHHFVHRYKLTNPEKDHLLSFFLFDDFCVNIFDHLEWTGEKKNIIKYFFLLIYERI